MKNKLLPLALVLFGSAAYSQVGIGTLNPDPSSQLEVSATDKGILIPRVALISRADTTTITPGNVDSLLVFNTTNNDNIKPGFYYWYVDRWEKFSNSSDLEELQNDNDGSISMVVVGTDLVLTDVHGNQTSIPLSDLNILTTLVNNNNGTYTYTSEDGTVTNINVTEDVANYFETILNEGPITIGGVTYNTFEEYLTHVVKSNETITTLVNNNNGTYTYVSENGTVTLIDVKGDVANYFSDILNEGPIIVDGDTYPTFQDYLTTIIQSKQTITTLVNNNNGSYTYTSEDGTVTNINVTEDVANYFETILNEGPITIGGNTYPTFEDYLTYVVKSNETITTLVNNNNGTYTYVSENGTVTLIDVKGDVANYFSDILNEGPIIVDGDTYPTFQDYLTTIIQSKQTITTLVNNNNGSYTYTSEDGTVTNINVTEDVANYFETILNEGPITIGGVTYNTFEEYLTHVVKSNETITTLVNNNNGTYTYVSENGTVTLIDVKGDVANYFTDILNEGPIIVDGDTYPTFQDYLTTIIQSKQTITTLVNNNNGSYTYTSEDGTVTNINVTEDVANYFETILNEGPITIGGVTYNTFEEYLTHVVKSNETITTLVNNNNGTYTYVSENGTVTLIDVKGDVANYFSDILNEGPIIVDGDTYPTFQDYLTTIIQSKQTITTLVNNNNGSYTYTSEDGTVTNINVTEDVANYFETILNEGPITIGGVTYNTFEEYLTHVVKSNETITTLVNNNNGTYTYVSENGTVTLIDVKGDVANYFSDILNEGPIIVDGDTYPTFQDYLTTIIQSKQTITTLVNNNNGSYTYTSEDGTVTNINVTEDVANYFETILNEGPITIGGNTYPTFEEYLTYVVKSNETITTLVNNNNGTYTYVSENGTVTLIDVKGDVANYFSDILNEGPIIVDGDTYPTFQDYLTTIIQSKQTITTLINNSNGTYTYTSEDGTTTTINVPADVANYFDTILNEGPITIGGDTYPTFEEYLTYVVKSNETITTLVNNDNGTYTYVSENGTVTLIDVKGDVANYFSDILNEGPIIVDGDTYPTFQDYLTTIIQSKQTITTLVNNSNGTYTYTSEDGTTTTIDVPGDVANYFETILNEGPITIGGNTYPTFEDYLTYVVKSNETITTLVNNDNGTYTYVSENGTVTLIDVKGDVANYFTDILNEGPIIVDGNTYPTFEDYLTTIIQSKQTITTLVNNNNGSYTYTSEDGTVTNINVTEDVANYFETILNEGPITIGGVTYNTFEEYLTHVVKSNETITTLVNNDNGTYTYVSENGTVTLIDVKGDVANYFTDILNEGPIIVDGDTYPTFEDYLTTIIQSKQTITTLAKTEVNGVVVPGSYTYTNESGAEFVFNVVEDVTNNFEEIFNIEENLEQLVTYLTNTTVGGNVKFDGDTFTYIDSQGNTQNVNFAEIVKANETLTTLAKTEVNGVVVPGSYTYTNESGAEFVFSVVEDVTNNFEEIFNIEENLEQLVTYLTNTTVGGNVKYDGNTFTYIDQAGVAQSVNFSTIVKANETVTSLVNNGTSFTYTNEANDSVTVNLLAGQTGADGKSAFEVWQEIPGNETKTLAEYLDAIRGADGKSAFEVWQEIPGNETKTVADYLAAITGPQGPAGADGKSAFEVWQEIPGNETKTLAEYLDAIKGADGVAGADGKSAFKVWQEIPGNENKTVTDFIEAIKGADGVAGADGKSAFEVWQEIPGNETKTLAEYLDAIKGADGVAGADGKSAFEVWQEIPGNETKTLQEYLDAITGPQGPVGQSVPQTITNALSSTGNSMTSTVNTNAASADIINSNVLTLNPTTNILTSTVNGVVSTGDPINLSTVGMESWNVQGGNDKATLVDDNIYHNGNVAIGNDATGVNLTVGGAIPKLYVAGDVAINGKLFTTNNVYADYVFEKYFTGESAIKSDYKFNRLSDVKEFIEKNHHLPGVTRIGDIERTADGYMIDYSKLSIEQLEKIEELYIHTIEQQDLIDKQSKEINSLKDQFKETNDYLKKLEKMLLNVQK